MSPRQPLLKLVNLTKQYPGCLANDAVSMQVDAGNIHALLGENGAGKSTLVKMVYGLLQPTSGKLFWQGDSISFTGPAQARAKGICMVFQHFSLFEALTVGENVALGLDRLPGKRELDEKIIQVSEAYGLPLEPDRQVHTMSVGERQRIEIARSLLQSPDLLIMDEPTSVLTPQEVNRLFDTLRQLREEGCSILYISHKLDEIKQLCDRATILRDGKVVAECDPQEESVSSLARMMIGSTPHTVSTVDHRAGNTVLRVNQLGTKSPHPFGIDLKHINFAVKAGEIVGIAGVAGNGQSELLDVLSGEQPTASTSIEINGKPCGHLSSVARRELGMAYVPENRLGHGAVPSMNLIENCILSGYKKQKLITRMGINIEAATAFANAIQQQFNVKSAGLASEAQSLSGGNLQKFIVGREISQKPEILLLGQPTWGVDAGSAAAIHQQIFDLVETGAAVLIVSQDLDELLMLSNRIAVISMGRLSEFQPVADVTAESLGLLMGAACTEKNEHDKT